MARDTGLRRSRGRDRRGLCGQRGVRRDPVARARLDRRGIACTGRPAARGLGRARRASRRARGGSERVGRARVLTLGPDVSILIVTYECRDEARGCLRSIAETSGAASTEIVVADNASTDGTVEMIRTEFPQVKLVALEENVGFAAGVNRAAAAAE